MPCPFSGTWFETIRRGERLTDMKTKTITLSANETALYEDRYSAGDAYRRMQRARCQKLADDDSGKVELVSADGVVFETFEDEHSAACTMSECAEGCPRAGRARPRVRRRSRMA